MIQQPSYYHDKFHSKVHLLAGENVLYVTRKHVIFFLITLLLPCFFGLIGIFIFLLFQNEIGFFISLVCLVLAAIAFYKVYTDFIGDVLVITNKRIIHRDSFIFGHHDHEVEYESVTGILPRSRGFIQWLLGYGAIIIKTKSGHSEEVIIPKIPKHEKVAHLIATYVDQYGDSAIKKDIPKIG